MAVLLALAVAAVIAAGLGALPGSATGARASGNAGGGPGAPGTSLAARAPGATGPRSSPFAAAPATRRRAHHPNIVFVLTDDLSMNLLRFMPEVQALTTSGMTFENYFVSDSLCCPSRASIFTGDYPHDTGVYTNDGPQGGIGAFFSHDDEMRSFNVALQRAGYRTAMMGKYLNGYLEGPNRSPFPPSYVPSGWNEWDVAGWGYPEFDYRMNIDGHVRWFGHRGRDYLTDVIARRGVRFIDRSARGHRPFFLELATFTPHSPYTPAPRDRHAFPGLTAPRPPSFDVMPTDPVSWLRGHPPLRPRQLRRINRYSPVCSPLSELNT
ncbi:MAG: sulfatase-like hydrolase/transferase, partial [Trebonia sp.]